MKAICGVMAYPMAYREWKSCLGSPYKPVIRTTYLFRAAKRIQTSTIHDRIYFLSGLKPMVGNTWITDEAAEENMKSGRYKLIPN